MKKRLPQIYIADRRRLPGTRSPILKAVPFLLLAALLCVPAAATGKSENGSQDPYATAESETAPAVNAADLAYRTILFEDFTIPLEWEAKARNLATATEDRAISRLSSTHAFTSIGKKQNTLPEEPYLLVKCTLSNYRMVGKATRFFAGWHSGTSHFTYQVQVFDGKNGALLFQREISSENTAIAAGWTFNDENLPAYLGNVLADYLALRARKDKGVNVIPLKNEAQTGSSAPPAQQPAPAVSASQPAPAASPLPQRGAATPAPQPAVPASQPSSAGPSLEVTMRFIQNKLNNQGPFSYIVFVRDEVSGQTWKNSWQTEESNFVADPGNCRIGYHNKIVRNSTTRQNEVTSISLKAVESVSVITAEQTFQLAHTQAGSHNLSYRVEPAFFVLRIQREETLFDDLAFHDEGMANRVAKAMLHAVDLCGGGRQEEPF